MSLMGSTGAEEEEEVEVEVGVGTVVEEEVGTEMLVERIEGALG